MLSKVSTTLVGVSGTLEAVGHRADGSVSYRWCVRCTSCQRVLGANDENKVPPHVCGRDS